MPEDITPLIYELENASGQKVHEASDALARIGTNEVLNAVVVLLDHPNLETRFLAARTLGLMENNETALNPLLTAIQNKENKSIAGDLLMALEGFNVSHSYVELFKLYLFGSYKVSKVAKELLDFQEFDITPRVLKKALKHWNHYTNNVKHDDAFELQKREVEDMMEGLKMFLDQSLA